MNALKIVEQGSEEWFQMKLGVISASNISKALAKKGTDTRNGYLAELVAQVCTGEMPEINARAMEWGKLHESSARAAYEFDHGISITQVGFIYGKDKRTGCSPDGLIKGLKKGVEIKCPFTSKVFIEFLCSGKIKKEYLDQMQFSLWVSGMETWDFVSYDPRMRANKLHVSTIERDPAMVERFENEIPEFIKDMDAMLEKTGFVFGEQWE